MAGRHGPAKCVIVRVFSRIRAYPENVDLWGLVNGRRWGTAALLSVLSYVCLGGFVRTPRMRICEKKRFVINKSNIK